MDAANGYEAVALNFIAARLPDGAPVLDVGCGWGEPIAAVFVEQGLAVYGVEASAFFDRPFHAIVAWGLLFPLPPATQRELIGKMGRALASGGCRLLAGCQYRSRVRVVGPHVAWEQISVWVRFANLRVCSARRAVILGKRPRRLFYNRRTAIALVHSRIVRCSFVALNLVQPNTAMQPTCSVGAISPSGGMGPLSRSIVFVPSSRTRLMANRWAAIRSVAIPGSICSRFCAAPEAFFLQTKIASAVQTNISHLPTLDK